ncbi:MAG: molybdenum ABC transporter ATP-binding protein [Pseudomonadota bacterium]
MSIEGLQIEAKLAFQGFALDIAATLSATGCSALYGPSGSGKSTLLRLIAGFQRPDAGRVALADRVWCDTAKGVFVPAHKRRIGYMFQDGHLFPHLTVEQNLAYADRRCERRDLRHSIDEITAMFKLGALLKRAPVDLSGGERQRAALARTLLTRPDLLLLDEPLSALDQAHKSTILPYLEDLPTRFGVPVLYVTHSVEEVARLADETIHMAQGRIVDIGPTERVLATYRPSLDGAFSEAGSVLQAEVEAHDEDLLLTHVRVGAASLAMPINRTKAVGDLVKIRIAARDVALATRAPDGLSIRNRLAAKITGLTPQPGSPFVDVDVQVDGVDLLARITRSALQDLQLQVGQDIIALVKSATFDT